MKVQKKSHKKAIIIAAIVLVIATGGGAYAYYAYTASEPAGDSQEQTTDENGSSSGNNKAADESASNSDQPANEKEKDTPTQYEGPDANASESLNGVINYKAVVDGSLTLRTTIDQRISSGSCALILTHANSGRTVARTAGISQNPSSSTCQGFNVPTSELGSGLWNIEIRVTGDGKAGTLEETITI